VQEGPVNLEQTVHELQTDVAVIRAHLDNHVAAMEGTLHELREDIRDLRNKVERLFGVYVGQPKRSTNGRTEDWKTIALVVSGWAFGLFMLVLEFLLKR
jgi:CHAD domain-containing protein